MLYNNKIEWILTFSSLPRMKNLLTKLEIYGIMRLYYTAIDF